MSYDGYGSDSGTESIPHDERSPSPSLPRVVQLRSRMIIYTDTATDNPSPHQPTPSSFLDNLTNPFNPIHPLPPTGTPPTRPSNPLDPSSLLPSSSSSSSSSSSTYSPTSSPFTASSSRRSSERLFRFERRFLGLHAARHALPIFRHGPPPTRHDDAPPEEAFMLSAHELRGLDADLYGHLDPAQHGLTFSRRQLRQLFDEADARWRTRTPSPTSPPPQTSSSSSSSTFSWEGVHRREQRQRILDAWEEFRTRLLPSPDMFRGVEDWGAREDFAPRVDAPRTSRRRRFDEVEPAEEDEGEARGRSRRRVEVEPDAEPRVRGPRRIRRPRGRRGGFAAGPSR